MDPDGLEIVRPGQAAYPALQHVYSEPGAPAFIVRPRDASEVPAALAFARAHDAPFAIRSGGHGISSRATNIGGTVIDLGHLDRIERVGEYTVRVGSGARWARVAAALSPWGLSITSGDSGDVGVGGLGTAGGIGLLTRLQGLTIDRIDSAEIVTADGELRRVAADAHPDLFWAVRGAGANTGIVTSFELRADPIGTVARASLVYRLDDAADFLERWGHVVENAPREVSAFLYLGGSGSAFAESTIVVATSDESIARDELSAFLTLPGLVGQRAALVPYAAVPLSSGAPHSGQQQARSHSALLRHLDRDAARRVARVLISPHVDMIHLRSMGGAVHDVAPDATAFAHRHQEFSVMAASQRGGAAFDTAWEPVHDIADGMYLSFESDHDASHVMEAFPPPTLSRLRAIKARWDPDRIFTQNFDVGADVVR
jgi:FAD/FMN-containing dehydrogenase